MKSTYDVIVFGGGTAGVVAAIQSARMGASTLLVEKNGMLGGTVTVAGINAPAHFFAWGRQVIAGIGWELVSSALQEAGQPVPNADFTRDNKRPHHLTVDFALFAALCDQAVLTSGADLLFHAMPAEIRRDDSDWHVRICTKEGLKTCRATTLIDATGDANVVSLAGFEVVRPDVLQPATLQMCCAGYDPAALDYEQLAVAARKAVAAGELVMTDVSWSNDGPKSFLQRHGHNANHFHAPDAHTSEGKTRAEVEGRASVLRMYRFFRKQPGLENFRLAYICPEAGIRETVTIKGMETISVEDYESGRMFEEALCYAYYPIDEHCNDGQPSNYRLLENNVLPTIPRGALLPQGSRNLIVAGRCLSSDREANSALRVECPCMAMGQAAGVMAALCAGTADDPASLPLEDIRRTLRNHGAVVPCAKQESGE